jgi:hypothetical protein
MHNQTPLKLHDNFNDLNLIIFDEITNQSKFAFQTTVRLEIHIIKNK